METRITNQASLDYSYNGTTAKAQSNIASATVTDPVKVEKRSLEISYRDGKELTYVISLVNSRTSVLENVTVTDDLGTYGIDTKFTPLTFISPAHLYIDGVFNRTITPSINEHDIEFEIASIAAGSDIEIIYKAMVNDAALLDTGSTIVNTVTVKATGMNNPVNASNTVTVEDYADIVIMKTMSPSEIVDGGVISYDFTIYNYGNTAATDNVLKDTFSPAPSGIAVYVDGTIVPDTEYTYLEGLLTLPSTESAYEILLPAATFVQDSTTGVVTIAPSVKAVKVTGTI